MRQLVVEKIVVDGHERSRFATFLDAPDASQISDAALQDSELARCFRHFPFFEPTGGLSQHLLLKIPAYAHAFSLLEFGGWYVGEAFTLWMHEKLDNARDGVKFSECTLKQFHEVTQRDLSLVASDTSEGEMLVLNHRTAPDCPLVSAVRMSMSFPFIWQEVIWKEAWGKYRGRWKAGNVIADGGLLSNFPIHLLVRPPVHGFIREIMGDDTGTAEDIGIMGLLLDHNRALDTANTVGSIPQNDRWFLHRPLRLLNTMLGAYDFDFIEENDAYICRIPVQGYGVTDFDLSEIRLEALIGSGYNAMVKHLKKPPGKVFSPSPKCLGM